MKTNDFVLLSIFMVGRKPYLVCSTFNGASAAPCVLVAWSLLYIILILGSYRFDKSARIGTVFSPKLLTTHFENLSCASPLGTLH